MSGKIKLKCLNGHELPINFNLFSEPSVHCPECGSSIFLENSFNGKDALYFSKAHLYWEYIEKLLPDGIVKKRISLGEGGTPLIKSKSIGSFGKSKGKIYFKDESRNPTKSYRDRAASLLVSHAVSLNHATIYSASNGNMGAAIAAYSARAGLAARIFSVKDIDIGKKSQILTYIGYIEDRFLTIDGATKECINRALDDDGYQATAELNPLSLLSQKTIAYEINSSGVIPDEIYISIGNGGTLFSIWQGFNDLKSMGLIEKVPRMIGAQINENHATSIIALLESKKFSQRDLAEYAIEKSNGIIVDVTQDEISKAISVLAKNEGLFVEPASAAAYAALLKHPGANDDFSRVVILTGTGLKAPIVIEMITEKRDFYTASRFQKKINLRINILAQLESVSELHGYGIYLSMKNRCSKQAVYQHLKRLEEKNFIVTKGTDDHGRKLYKITEKGKKVLDLMKQLVELL
ncbi:MAG: pyridoxal-phosphate dependent enzyme [Promethearchaeota archaeon]